MGSTRDTGQGEAGAARVLARVIQERQPRSNLWKRRRLNGSGVMQQEAERHPRREFQSTSDDPSHMVELKSVKAEAERLRCP
jgi:hypothetical protein